MRARAPDLVIFDCDGVLVDTEPTSNRVLCELIRELGDDIDVARTTELYKGLSMKECVRRIEARLGVVTPPDFLDRYYANILEAFAREVSAIPHVADAIDRIVVPTCVASSGPHRKMGVTLRGAGLWERFEGRIYSATEVKAGKPAPDLFLHAAASMGADPAACAVIEDSEPGVAAALAAGMRALGYAADDEARSVLGAAGAEVFSDMRKLPELLGFRQVANG